MSNNNLYIACIDLTDKPCLVVGAGPIALEKIEGLLASGARVTVVAPEAVEEVRTFAEVGAVDLVQRPFTDEDLDERFLVIAATGRRSVNEAVHSGAERRMMLVNVADVPDLCNFILPAITRSGRLALAVSTAGASPALAKRMKREAAATFGPEYARLAEILEDLRPWARETLPTYQARRDLFESIVNGDPDPIDLLRRGEEHAVHRLIEERRHAHTTSD
jgi:siroheme synthase-like protein